MEVAVRDGSLYQCGFATGAEGMRYLGVTAVEVAIDKDGTVRSLGSDRNLNLTQAADLAAFQDELKTNGLRVCAFLCSQNFNAPDDRQAHVNWVVQAVRAAG